MLKDADDFADKMSTAYSDIRQLMKAINIIYAENKEAFALAGTTVVVMVADDTCGDGEPQIQMILGCKDGFNTIKNWLSGFDFDSHYDCQNQNVAVSLHGIGNDNEEQS